MGEKSNEERMEELLDNWKDLICYSAASGIPVSLQNIHQMPHIIQDAFQNICKTVVGKRIDVMLKSSGAGSFRT